MSDKYFKYNCPNAANCSIHKQCHVLATGVELKHAIPVWVKCKEKNEEILVHIGRAI